MEAFGGAVGLGYRHLETDLEGHRPTVSWSVSMTPPWTAPPTDQGQWSELSFDRAFGS